MVTFNENHRMSSSVIKVTFRWWMVASCLFFVYSTSCSAGPRGAPVKLIPDVALEMLWENHCKEPIIFLGFEEATSGEGRT